MNVSSGSSKSQATSNFLDFLSDLAYGNKRSDALDNLLCVSCGKPIGEFRDDLSLQEYRISGLCQKCQDEFFVGDEDEL